MESVTVRFAHISDIHISNYGNQGFILSAEAARFLAEILEELNGHPDVDFIFISGDCLNAAHSAELARFEQILALSRKPVLVTPGNHDGNAADDPQVFTQRFFARRFNPQYTHRPETGQAGYFSVPVKEGIQFIGLDTAIPGQVGGGIDAAQLNWLADELARCAGKAVIVGCHHPLHPLCPADLNGKWRDWFVCANGLSVQALLNSSPAVKMVLYGHHHAGRVFRLGEQAHLASPALSSYPCAYRIVELTGQGDAWQVGWKQIAALETVQQQAALALKQSDFSLEYNPLDGSRFAAFAEGTALEWNFQGSAQLLPENPLING